MNCIDLDAIKTDLERQMDRNNPNWSWNNETACYDLLEYLAKFPVIDPVRRGHWIDDGDCFICSHCRSAFGFLSSKCLTIYCPCCGAKMDGDKNG